MKEILSYSLLIVLYFLRKSKKVVHLENGIFIIILYNKNYDSYCIRVIVFKCSLFNVFPTSSQSLQ
jgi:hypothetical protein